METQPKGLDPADTGNKRALPTRIATRPRTALNTKRTGEFQLVKAYFATYFLMGVASALLKLLLYFDGK